MPPERLETLYDEHAAGLFRYARSILANEQAAKDVLQDVFVKLAGSGTPEVENEKAWLYRLAHNSAIDNSGDPRPAVSTSTPHGQIRNPPVRRTLVPIPTAPNWPANSMPPWPKKLFLDALNAGLAQGFYARPGGAGDLADYDSAKDEAIVIEEKAPKPTPTPGGKPKPSFPGYESPEAELQIHELQDLEEHIDKLNSLLSGCDMRVVVKIRAKGDAQAKAKEVADLLEKVKKGWEELSDSGPI